MSFEIFVVLFFVISAISSLINRAQSRGRLERPKRSTPRARRTPRQSRPDLSDWDLFGPETPAVPPVPSAAVSREASHAPTPAEFREASPGRDVEERATGTEYVAPGPPPRSRSLLAAVPAYRRLTLGEAAAEVKAGPVRAAGEPRRAGQTARRRGLALKIDARSLSQAVVFHEILGPPRGDVMPW